MYLVTSLGTFDNLPDFFEAVKNKAAHTKPDYCPVEHVCPSCHTKHWELGALCSYCNRGY